MCRLGRLLQLFRLRRLRGTANQQLVFLPLPPQLRLQPLHLPKTPLLLLQQHHLEIQLCHGPLNKQNQCVEDELLPLGPWLDHFQV